ncbi:hypothetical protein [Duganella violaceipulchra]|uniref:Uncharacterized protein n=1 Tax=Duganella violaceipulchra TaxID=2849652 RepID=A0AA41HF79_9BURK|nr:hypothetical protein [Duganella violaceicalia]MBV6324980.1 hypothetical protein [Duganella violaceicalia]MCP2009159.1 hypothetical protein [Duganella violaceicalia]
MALIVQHGAEKKPADLVDAGQSCGIVLGFHLPYQPFAFLIAKVARNQAGDPAGAGLVARIRLFAQQVGGRRNGRRRLW